MGLGRVFGSLRDGLIKGFIGGRLKDAGEGKSGDTPKRVYWWVHDHAVWVGLALGALDYGLVALTGGNACPVWLNCVEARTWVAYVAEVLVAGGIAVNFHAADPPRLPDQMHGRSTDEIADLVPDVNAAGTKARRD